MRHRSRSKNYERSFRSSKRESSKCRERRSSDRHRDEYRRNKRSQERSKFDHRRNSDTDDRSDINDVRYKEYKSSKCKEENNDDRPYVSDIRYKDYKSSKCKEEKSTHDNKTFRHDNQNRYSSSHSDMSHKKSKHKNENVKAKPSNIKISEEDKIKNDKNKEKDKKIKKKARKSDKDKKKRKRQKQSCEVDQNCEEPKKYSNYTDSYDKDNTSVKLEPINSLELNIDSVKPIECNKVSDCRKLEELPDEKHVMKTKKSKESDHKSKIKSDGDKKYSKHHSQLKDIKEKKSDYEDRRSSHRDKFISRKDSKSPISETEYHKNKRKVKHKSKDSVTNTNIDEKKRHELILFEDERLELPVTPTDAQYTGLFTKLNEETVSETEIEDILPPVLLDDQMKALLENDPNVTQELWDSEDDILNNKSEQFNGPKHRNIFDTLTVPWKTLINESTVKKHLKSQSTQGSNVSQIFLNNGISEKFAGENLLLTIRKKFGVTTLNSVAAIHNNLFLINSRKKEFFIERDSIGDALSARKDLIIRKILCNRIF